MQNQSLLKALVARAEAKVRETGQRLLPPEVQPLVEEVRRGNSSWRALAAEQDMVVQHGSRSFTCHYSRKDQSLHFTGALDSTEALRTLINFLQTVASDLTLEEGLALDSLTEGKDLLEPCTHPDQVAWGEVGLVHGPVFGRSWHVTRCTRCQRLIYHQEWVV